MALIKCPECFNEVSDKATSCPKCGRPLQPAPSQPVVENTDPHNLTEQISDAITRSGKRTAIRLYCDLTKSSLSKAEEFVEKIDRDLRSGALVRKPHPISNQSSQRKLSPIALVGPIILILAFAAMIAFTYNRAVSLEKNRNSRDNLNPSANAQSSAGIPLSYISWSELDAIYNVKSAYTDLQKDEYWKKYQGKKVRWTGTVKSISDSFGSLNLQLKMNSDTLLIADVYVRLKNTERSKALKLHEGDSISFTGILGKWGSLLPITLNDGEID